MAQSTRPLALCTLPIPANDVWPEPSACRVLPFRSPKAERALRASLAAASYKVLLAMQEMMTANPAADRPSSPLARNYSHCIFLLCAMRKVLRNCGEPEAYGCPDDLSSATSVLFRAADRLEGKHPENDEIRVQAGAP